MCCERTTLMRQSRRYIRGCRLYIIQLRISRVQVYLYNTELNAITQLQQIVGIYYIFIYSIYLHFIYIYIYNDLSLFD